MLFDCIYELTMWNKRTVLIDLDEETLNKGEGDGPHAQSDYVEKAEQDPEKSKRTAFVSNLDYSIDEDGIGQIFAKVSSQVIVYNKLNILFVLFLMFFLSVWFASLQ